MGSYISDILSNAPIAIVSVTVLAAMVVESVRGTRPGAVSWIGIFGCAFAALFAVTHLASEGFSFGGMLRHGGFGNFFNAIFCLLAVCVILLSKEYLERQNYHRGEFYILILFATLGMMLVASAEDLIVLFLGIEIVSISFYVLAGFFRTQDRSNEASLKYFLLGAFSTGFLLYGIALIYGSAGSTNITTIKNSFPVVSTQSIFLLGVGLFLVGLSFKAAVVPFHMWVPDVYEGAPTPVTAFMSTGAKAAAFAAFITLFIRSFDFIGGPVNQLLAILAAGSMILGNTAAIAQSNIKRMLAYSSIAHAGYMLAGIASGTLEGQIGVMYYLAAYSVMNLGAFAIIGSIERTDGKTLLMEEYTNLGHSRPLLAYAMAVFMFALSGVPPFAGFFGKYYVFAAAIRADMVWLAVVGVLTSVLSAYYYLRLVMIMFFRDGKSPQIDPPSTSVLLVIGLCVLLIILFGLFPSIIIQHVQNYL